MLYLLFLNEVIYIWLFSLGFPSMVLRNMSLLNQVLHKYFKSL